MLFCVWLILTPSKLASAAGVENSTAERQSLKFPFASLGSHITQGFSHFHPFHTSCKQDQLDINILTKPDQQ